jgi:hypothetical protein
MDCFSSATSLDHRPDLLRRHNATASFIARENYMGVYALCDISIVNFVLLSRKVSVI